MKIRRLFLGTIAAHILALALLLGAPSAHAMYYNGSFLGHMTGASGSSSFVLPAGSLFPQVSLTDLTVGADSTVSVYNGATMDFTLTLGEFAENGLTGTMRYTFFQIDTPDGARVFLLGSYTLNLGNDTGPYPVSGPVIGDQYGIYLPGRNNGNTPADPSDDETFLVRARISPVGDDPINPTYLGRAQVLVGKRLLSTMTDALTTTTTFAGTPASLAGSGLANGSTFNQIMRADVVLGEDTAAVFVSNITRTGTIGAGDPYSNATHALRLAPGGPGTAGIGIFLTRFTRVVPGGKTMEGFAVADIEAPSGGSSAVEGYYFAFVTPQTSPALLFGTLSGTATSTGATATITAELREVDSTPPDALPAEDDPELYTDRYQSYSAAASDLNGWRDLKSVQFLVNDSATVNRLVARYDVATNRLALYNKTSGTWTAGCLPGSNTTLRTPWVSLSCKNTTVTRSGEFLSVDWNLKPTAKMLGSWNSYLQATDRSGQASGLRAITGGKVTIKTTP